MYKFAQDVINDKIMPFMVSSNIEKAAIFGYPHGELRAWAPTDFKPDKQGIADIISAFQVCHLQFY